MRIIKSSVQTLVGLTSDETVTVKNALTFNNPKYLSAKRYSRSEYISIPPYLHYYDEDVFNVISKADNKAEKVLNVPIGVNVGKILDKEIKDVVDKRQEIFVEYPKFRLELRDTQKIAEKTYLTQPLSDVKGIIQLPTGKGKSILALHIAQRLNQKTLILVHKDDLVVGWTKDIKMCFGDDFEVGLIKAKKRKVGKQITIATVQTLSRMSEEELSQYTSQFGLVVQDEVHHVGLNIFNIINSFNSYYKIGLSATPKRSDGLDFVFDLFFGGICYKYEYDPKDEDISQVKVIVRESPVKYKPFMDNSNMVYNYHDFNKEELPKTIRFLEDMEYSNRPTIPNLIIDNAVVKDRKHKIFVCKDIINEYKQGHSIIALFTQKEHINIYYRYLCRYIPKDKIMLYYGDSKESSETLMKKAESKEVLVTLATYAKATEGTNVKSWEVEFLVSSVNNEKNVEQATGRIRRTKDGKLNPVVVYDYRCKDVYTIRSHFDTRLKVYKKLKYIIEGYVPDKTSKGLFSRGYKK